MSVKKQFSGRIYFLTILFIICGAVLAGRLFYLQIVKFGYYSKKANNQQEIVKKLFPRRGEIFMQDLSAGRNNNDKPKLIPVATNREFYLVYAVPSVIEESKRDEIALKLSEVLQINKDEILKKISKADDPYELIKQKISDEVSQQIKDLKFKGIGLAAESWRYYSYGSMASNVLGFLGIDVDKRVGRYGVEGYYEKTLAGQDGYIKSAKDVSGTEIFSGDYDIEPARDGESLVLTIDQNIQFVLEQKLKETVDKYGAPFACGAIMDPADGDILAMASYPNFDPNEYNKVKDISIFLNSCVQTPFEPGSVFKPFTMAAGIDTKKVTPQTAYDDFGSVKIGKYTVSNALKKSFGHVTMTNVLEHSINTGVVFVEQLLGHELFKKYVEDFGFGKITGIDLMGEAKSNLRNLNSAIDVNFATATFGQGIAVTPIQILQATGALANHGKMMQPRVVEKIIHPDGSEEEIAPKEVKQVISTETASKITAMLVSTVKQGYDKVKIQNYYVAGKTGTAQVPLSNGRGYDPDATVHSFISYAPAFDPKFVSILVLQQPNGISWAANSLTPVFSDIGQYILDYMQIPPDNK